MENVVGFLQDLGERLRDPNELYVLNNIQKSTVKMLLCTVHITVSNGCSKQ